MRSYRYLIILNICLIVVGGMLPLTRAKAEEALGLNISDASQETQGDDQTYAFLDDMWGLFPSRVTVSDFDRPSGVAVDPVGNIYVADSERNRIKKFNADGGHVTGWGSAGSGEGEFDHPTFLAVDQAGHLYVADRGNDRIQKFSLDGTFVTAWGSEGAGEGQFSQPAGIAIDEEGYVYVADHWGHRIQKFTSEGSFVTAWGCVGEEEDQLYRPIGIAIHQGYLYSVELLSSAYGWDYRIQKFTLDGTFVATWGSRGSADGELYNPWGIAVSQDGYVYVAERYRVQKFTSTGEFVATWGSEGTDAGQFGFTTDIAIDHQGNVYVADTGNDRIQELTSDGEFVSMWGSGPPTTAEVYYDLHGRRDYAVGRFGALLEQEFYDGARRTKIESYPDHELRYYALGYYIYDSGRITTHYSGGRIDRQEWCPDPDDDQCYTVRRYIYDGVRLDRVDVYYYDTDNPYPHREHEQTGIAIAAGADGSIYAAIQDVDSRSIKIFASDGTLVNQWDGGNPDASFSFWALRDVATDSAGDVYVCDSYWETLYDQYGNKMDTFTVFRVRRYDSDGNFLDGWRLAYRGMLSSPAAIAIDQAGYAYIALTDLHAIWRLDPDGNSISWGGEGNGEGEFSHPKGIAVAPDGSVYVADSGNDRIQRFTSGGAFIAQWGSPGVDAGQFSWPSSIAVCGEGNVYVTEVEGHRVQKFTPEGDFIIQWGSGGKGAGELSGPSGVAVDSDGSLYVLDTGNYRIQKFVEQPYHGPKIRNLRSDAEGNIVIKVPVIPLYQYQLQESSDLHTWVDKDVTSIAGQTFDKIRPEVEQLLDLIAGNVHEHGMMFYRIVQEPRD